MCIHTYEKANPLRLAICLYSLMHNYVKRNDVALIKYYYDYIGMYDANSLDEDVIMSTAKAFFADGAFFVPETKPIPKALQLTLLVDTADPPTLDAMQVKVFGKFCTEYIISNYKVVYAMKNYRIPVMRTLAFRTCNADWLTSSDDDDLHAMSMIRRYEIAKEVSQTVSPTNESITISFEPMVMANNKAEPAVFERTTVAIWGKIFSKKLYDQLYFLPAPAGGEDFVLIRHILPQINDPTYRDIKYSPRRRIPADETILKANEPPFYIWFPSNRNFPSKELQKEMIKLHTRGSSITLGKNTTASEIQQKDYAKYDVIYHEDEIVGVNVFDNTHSEAYQQYFFITNSSKRNVHIEGTEVVYDGQTKPPTKTPKPKWPRTFFERIEVEQTPPSWLRPRMSIDYYNAHLRTDTPYVLRV